VRAISNAGAITKVTSMIKREYTREQKEERLRNREWIREKGVVLNLSWVKAKRSERERGKKQEREKERE
jgi:hypothetical protein